MVQKAILICEDMESIVHTLTEECIEAFPDIKVIAVGTLAGAKQVLEDKNYDIQAVITDNSYPVYINQWGKNLHACSYYDGGHTSQNAPKLETRWKAQRAKHGWASGSGTCLTELLRSKKLGERYSTLPIVLQTGDMSDGKVEEIVHTYGGFTQCCRKEKGHEVAVLADYFKNPNMAVVPHTELEKQLPYGWKHTEFKQFCRMSQRLDELAFIYGVEYEDELYLRRAAKIASREHDEDKVYMYRQELSLLEPIEQKLQAAIREIDANTQEAPARFR